MNRDDNDGDENNDEDEVNHDDHNNDDDEFLDDNVQSTTDTHSQGQWERSE